MIAMPVPGEVSFLHSFRQFRRIAFHFFRRLQPMAPGGDTVHPLLVERVAHNIAARHTETGLRQ